jgi:hypothetical protein
MLAASKAGDSGSSFGGAFSVVPSNSILIVVDMALYSIDDNLLPFFKKRIILEYDIAVRIISV